MYRGVDEVRNSRRHPGVTLPSVNLLSPWVFEGLATRRLRKRFLLVACLLVLAMAGGWAVQHLRVTQAKQVLGVEQAETTRLTAETTKLAPVRAFVTTVQHQEETVQDTMAGEVYLSQVLEGLQASTPQGARVETVSVTLAPPPASPGSALSDGAVPADQVAPPGSGAPTTVSACPGPDPFNTRVVVGCVTLSGSASSRTTVGDFVIRLGDSVLFVEPFISTTTTADAERVMFTGSVGLSERAFSERYARLERLPARGGPR